MLTMKTVPGAPASSLMVRGYAIEVAAFLCVIPIALESYLPGAWWAWGGSFLLLALVLLVGAVVLTFKSSARAKVEKQRGYTTIWTVATEDPHLTYVDGKDGRVIAAAGESRPATGRRSDLEAAKARYVE
jgi:hypothetical protein